MKKRQGYSNKIMEEINMLDVPEMNDLGQKMLDKKLSLVEEELIFGVEFHIMECHNY